MSIEKIIESIAIIKINPLIIKNIEKECIYLDLNLLEVFNYKETKICFKCCQFGHKLENCIKNYIICIKCNNNHFLKIAELILFIMNVLIVKNLIQKVIENISQALFVVQLD